MIKIIEHRTGWCDDFVNFEDKKLQNTEQGFENSFSRGNGVETDIRDVCGKLIISHNMPKGNEMSFEGILKTYNKYSCEGFLALNVKCDGMQDEIKTLLNKYNIKNYFMFDMSVPDAIIYLQKEIDCYIRDSEYELYPKETSPYFYEKASGVWLDQFTENRNDKIDLKLIKKYLNDNKNICIVSPELHSWGRKNDLYIQRWEEYKSIINTLRKEEYDLNKISLCTDLPIQAKDFFNN